jgi:GxxExxY protein
MVIVAILPKESPWIGTAAILHVVIHMRERLNALTAIIIAAALEVHREVGPGLLEHAYEACLVWELAARGLSVERQKPLPVVYKSQRLDCGYRIDLVVEGLIIVEIKAVEKLERVHSAQLLSYLRFARCPVGLLFNFNAGWLTEEGLKRIVNDFPE